MTMPLSTLHRGSLLLLISILHLGTHLASGAYQPSRPSCS